MKVKVSRKAHFNAAHRLYRKDWTEDKNNDERINQIRTCNDWDGTNKENHPEKAWLGRS